MLYELIWAIPVHGAPPRLSGEGAAIGLAFLDASLSLSHVKRLTETITVHERAGARKHTEVDINLAFLGQDPRNASDMLAELVRAIGARGAVAGLDRGEARRGSPGSAIRERDPFSDRGARSGASWCTQRLLTAVGPSYSR